MLPFERREKIMALMETEKMIAVQNIAAKLFVSEATLRRDLTILEEEGRIRRTHGGAALPIQRMTDIPLYARRQERMVEKCAIARAAARFFEPGDTLMLDASTTVLALSQEMQSMDSLTVITSGLITAQAFIAPGRQILLTGGTLREGAASLSGEDAMAFIRNHHATWSVLSCRGLNEEGLWESSTEEASLKRCMIKASSKHMLLCDSSKINQYFLCRTAELKSLHVLITDKTLEEPLYSLLKQLNIETVIAS